MRIRQAAELLGVSDDTVRRWIDNGTLPAGQDQAGRKVISGRCAGRVLARQCPVATAKPARHQKLSAQPFRRVGHRCAERQGDDTRGDAVRASHHRVADEHRGGSGTRGPEPGSLAVAVVKATTVIVETPQAPEEPSAD